MKHSFLLISILLIVVPTQGNTCLEQVLVSVIEQSENASLAKININKAIELINELKATNGISSFKANMDDFWLDLNRIIHPKANFTRITDEQRLWQIKSEKADELSNIFPQLTLPEIVAIRSYASYSEVVNSALYDLNTEKINRYKNYINVLSSALSKVESYDGMVYRTKKISREYSRNKYVVGKIVTETELSKTVTETLAVIAFKYPIKQSDLIKIIPIRLLLQIHLLVFIFQMIVD